MSPSLGILFILLGAGAFMLFVVRLERATGHAGLTTLAGGLSSLSAGVLGLVTTPGFLHALFILQAVGFHYLYVMRRREARNPGSGAPGV